MSSEAGRAPLERASPGGGGCPPPELPGLADEIIEAISHACRTTRGHWRARSAMPCVPASTERCASSWRWWSAPRTIAAPGRRVYVDLGRGEMLAGRSLDSLLAAYRLGARVAWRRLAAAGEAAGLEPRVLYLLAESIFAYIDELSGESVEGYAREQAAAAGELQRLRRRLAGLLVQDPPADRQAVEAAALAAGWSLPRTLAAVVTDGTEPDRLAMRLGMEVIGVRLPPGVCALVPDPSGPGRRAQIETALGKRVSVLGPEVQWHEAAVSAARARATLALAKDGKVAATGRGPLLADDHRLALLLAADPRLVADLAADALAPLDSETKTSRERLTATLLAWLALRWSHRAGGRRPARASADGPLPPRPPA